MSLKHNWIVDTDGLVYNKQKTRIGFFDTDGTVYTPGLSKKLGLVDINGNIYDEYKSPLGFVDADGTICDQNKKIVGFVGVSGFVYRDKQGAVVGQVLPTIHKL